MTSQRAAVRSTLTHMVAAAALAVPCGFLAGYAIALCWAAILGYVFGALYSVLVFGPTFHHFSRFEGSASLGLLASMRAASGRAVLWLLFPGLWVVLHTAFKPIIGHWGDFEPLLTAFAAMLLFGLFVQGFDHRRAAHLSPTRGTKVRRVVRPERSSPSRRVTGHASSSDEEVRVRWGPLLLPDRVTEGNFCVVGSPGSGKTLTLRHLMQTTLPLVGRRDDWRAVVYDAKRDTMSTLAGMNLAVKPVVLNPFDARSVAWNMADDIRTPAAALHAAATMIPEEKGAEGQFFVDAARALLTGLFVAFHELNGDRWTLRDVLVAARDPQRLSEVLRAAKRTAHLVKQFLDVGDSPESNHPKTVASIRSTLASRTFPFEPIGALWSKNTAESVSLREWVTKPGILVLGTDATSRTPLDAINRILFQRLTELLLDQPESKTRRCWVFLDEVREAGNLERLSSLLVQGRSKGVRVALGFQDIDGMRSVYGRERANELAGLCSHKALLRTDSDVTARWASDHIGEWEGSVISRSESDDALTITRNIVKKQAVLPSELMRLPPPTGGELHGYYISPKFGVLQATVPFTDGLLSPGEAKDFEPRDELHQYLDEWDHEDLARLKIPKPAKALEPPPKEDERPDGIRSPFDDDE